MEQALGQLQIFPFAGAAVEVQNTTDAGEGRVGLHGQTDKIDLAKLLDHLLQKPLEFGDVQIAVSGGQSIQAHIGAADIPWTDTTVHTVAGETAVGVALENAFFRLHRIPGVSAAPQRQIQVAHDGIGGILRRFIPSQPAIFQ